MTTKHRDLLDSVHAFNTIGQTTPPDHRFNADRVCFHTGMQFEELAEKTKAIAGGAVSQEEREYLSDLAHQLKQVGIAFKGGTHMGAILRADREQLIDADADILVVTAGSAMYQTPNFAASIDRVLDANDAKFHDGVAVRDANGKIQKPEGWLPPDHSDLIVPFND